jgi:hypothetical protein
MTFHRSREQNPGPRSQESADSGKSARASLPLTPGPRLSVHLRTHPRTKHASFQGHKAMNVAALTTGQQILPSSGSRPTPPSTGRFYQATIASTLLHSRTLVVRSSASSGLLAYAFTSMHLTTSCLLGHCIGVFGVNHRDSYCGGVEHVIGGFTRSLVRTATLISTSP